MSATTRRRAVRSPRAIPIDLPQLLRRLEQPMRSYELNSPQAAARLVALAMLADGHVSPKELAVIDRLDAAARLGLDRAAFMDVMQALCDDLLHAAQLSWTDACRIDPRTLAALLDEVQDPALRERVLGLCCEVAQADGDVGEAETIVLMAAVRRWGLQQALLTTPA